MSTTIGQQDADNWLDGGPAAADVTDGPPEASPPGVAWRGADVVIRGIDLTVSLLIMVLLAWLLVVLALVVRLTSPGPAIFRQRRVGHGERVFTVYKFRTMYVDAGDGPHIAYARQVVGSSVPHSDDGRLYKLVDDRITRVGRFLRKTSLDELPQLWNVVRGEMSLVGPRPVVTYEVDLYPGWYRQRFNVKPGLTGLWQVSGRSLLTYEEMMELDIDFAKRRSLTLYLSILARTVPALLFHSHTA
jgi:lipopolysaccharide/colanic/teichoic acid biosynthesis glycosyltransferase